MYLMKLNYGKEFGTVAGAQWRMLFVLALFPWLRNYRVRDDNPVPSAGASPSNDAAFPSSGNMGTSSRLDSEDIHKMRLEVELARQAYAGVAKRNRKLRRRRQQKEVENNEYRKVNRKLQKQLQEAERKIRLLSAPRNSGGQASMN